MNGLKNDRQIAFIFAGILILAFANLESFAQEFTRINSSTRSNIRSITLVNDSKGYFLTDQLYELNGDTWKRLKFNDIEKIDLFFCFDSDDVWLTSNLKTSASDLFHYQNGHLEKIPSPFANEITAIFFPSKKLGFFAGFSEIAVLTNEGFHNLDPLPERALVTGIYGESANDFWALTRNGNLYHYYDGLYHRKLDTCHVRDFHFLNPSLGYLMTDHEVFKVENGEIDEVCRSEQLNAANKICTVDENQCWIAGRNGLFFHYSFGGLQPRNVPVYEDFFDFSVTPTGDIWIAGENGTLLYSGSHDFQPYNPKQPGFTAHKILYFGIDADDEYGIAFADFNGDRTDDIYAVCIYNPNRLFINWMNEAEDRYPESGFLEETAVRNANGLIKPNTSAGLSELFLGVTAADIENDGDADVYLSSLNAGNRLLLNRGNGYFRDVSPQNHRACENILRSNTAAFSDVDLDGDLDLFMTSENASNRLYVNDGTGHFSDVTEQSGLKSNGGGMCASFSDINQDGLPDLCVSFWYPGNKLYLNMSVGGQVRFKDITESTDLAKAGPAKSNGVAFADVNNDGHQDLFIASRHSLNRLYLNDGFGIFRDVTTEYLGEEEYLSNGAVFADFNLDGYQDLYVTNVGQNILYQNMEGKSFINMTEEYGAGLFGYGTGCAVSDVDKDGDPDLYAAIYTGGNSMLFVNRIDEKSTATVRLQGTRSNRDAIGAKLWLMQVDSNAKHPTLAAYQEISGGGGYGSKNGKDVIFALRPGTQHFIKVKFPCSPDTLTIEHVEPGMYIELAESVGWDAMATRTGKAITRFFTDRETQAEIGKFLIIILLFGIYLVIFRTGQRPVRLWRWGACIMIFLLFILINHLFLFHTNPANFYLSPLVAVISLLIMHLVIERIVLKRLAEKEKTDLREMIARDLHDDLASTLGTISIYSDTLHTLKEPAPDSVNKLSAKISDLAHLAKQSISDIIWMTSPRNDTCQGLILKSSNLLMDILNDNDIRFKSDIRIPDHPVVLAERLRNNAFLIIKEGLHNIIRHSKASQVDFYAEIKDGHCIIQLTDNGLGFIINDNAGEYRPGNGLINMRKRAMESAIELSLSSKPGEGVQIELDFAI